MEVHQYLDEWGNGKTGLAQRGSGKRLDGVTAWAEKTGRRLYLGETGCTFDAASIAEMKTMQATMRSWSGWVGMAWWCSLGFKHDPNNRWCNLDLIGKADDARIAALQAP